MAYPALAVKPEPDFRRETVRDKQAAFIRRHVIGDDTRGLNKREAIP